VDTTAQSAQQNMWTQRHKAQNKTCEHSGTKHKSKTCGHNGTKHKAKHVDTTAQSTKRNVTHNEATHKAKCERNGTEHKVKHVKREKHKAQSDICDSHYSSHKNVKLRKGLGRAE